MVLFVCESSEQYYYSFRLFYSRFIVNKPKINLHKFVDSFFNIMPFPHASCFMYLYKGLHEQFSAIING